MHQQTSCFYRSSTVYKVQKTSLCCLWSCPCKIFLKGSRTCQQLKANLEQRALRPTLILANCQHTRKHLHSCSPHYRRFAKRHAKTYASTWTNQHMYRQSPRKLHICNFVRICKNMQNMQIFTFQTRPTRSTKYGVFFFSW